MGKLKPSWVKTDIPKGIKIKYHWKAIMEAPTYQGWQQALARMEWQAEDMKYARVSWDTYVRLKKEIEEMPDFELDTLPPELKSWILSARKPLAETKEKSIKHLPKGAIVEKRPPRLWHIRYRYESLKEFVKPIGMIDKRGLSLVKDLYEPKAPTGDDIVGKYPKEARKHDATIFEESNEILNEQDLMELVDNLLVDISYYGFQFMKVTQFPRFFDSEGKKYISTKLKELTDILCVALNELTLFLQVKFVIDYHAKQLISKRKYHLWPQLDDFWSALDELDEEEGDDREEDLDNRFGEDLDRFEEEYDRLNQLLINLYVAYKDYRSYVRQILFR